MIPLSSGPVPGTAEAVIIGGGINGLATARELAREGVVIRPHDERRHDIIGRVILKSVSDAYLLRKNGTEHN